MSCVVDAVVVFQEGLSENELQSALGLAKVSNDREVLTCLASEKSDEILRNDILLLCEGKIGTSDNKRDILQVGVLIRRDGNKTTVLVDCESRDVSI